jgi:hypothetical protein
VGNAKRAHRRSRLHGHRMAHHRSMVRNDFRFQTAWTHNRSFSRRITPGLCECYGPFETDLVCQNHSCSLWSEKVLQIPANAFS